MIETLYFHPSNDYTGSTLVLRNIIEANDAPMAFVITKDISGSGFLSELKKVRIVKICFPLLHGSPIKIISPIISNIHLMLLAILFGIKHKTFYINTILPSTAAIVGWMMQKRIVYHVHEKMVRRDGRVKIKEYVRYKTADLSIYVSQYTKQQYARNKGQEIVIYNKLSQQFLFKVKYIPLPKRTLNRIIMLSSFSKAKGIFTFIELAKRNPQYQFTLVLSISVERLEKLDIAQTNNLKVLPKQSNIHPLLMDSDLLLNLSQPKLWIETFGLTIIEAMAYGIPAIVPKVGGPTEIVIDGFNGYCVDVTDTAVIGKTIETVFVPENYHKLAQNSLNRLPLFTNGTKVD